MAKAYVAWMSEEQDNALAIARLEGDRAAVRAEMQAMEARIDASLERLEKEIAKQASEVSKRETRLLLSVTAITGLGIAILGFIL